MDPTIYEVANNVVKRNPLAFLESLIPGGEVKGQDYLPLNPTRGDKTAGSLVINMGDGGFVDYADESFRGGDFVALVALVKGMDQREAAAWIVKYDGQTLELPTKEIHAAKKLEWTPIIPAKNEPDTDLFKRYGKEYISQMPSNWWTYRSACGGIAFIVARYELDPDIDKKGRNKIYAGWTYGKNAQGLEGWHNKFPPAPRQLYNLPDFADDGPVLFVEGEKAAEAAKKLLPGHIVTTVVNGSQAAKKTDMGPCKGRKVLLWPDKDKAGADWVDRIAYYVHQSGADQIDILNLKNDAFADKPDKWDAADAVDDGWQPETLLTIIKAPKSTYEWDIPKAALPPVQAKIDTVPHVDSPDDKIQKVKQMIADDGAKLKLIVAAISQIDDAMDREELVTMAAKKHGWGKTVISRHVETMARVTHTNADTESTKGYGSLNIEALTPHYIVRAKGVWPSKRVGDGDSSHFEPDYYKIIATRPFWPNRLGIDAKTKESWVELAWKNQRGHERTEWMKSTDAKRRSILLELDGIPITDANFKDCARYIDTAMQCVGGDPMPVYTAIGWAHNRWHWPKANTEVVYAGPVIGEPGPLSCWKDGLKGIVDLGQPGYLALACIGASIASCMCAIVSNERSPVIGLTHTSSSGKGTVLNFAMSVWGDPQPRRFETSSTQRGIEDTSVMWSNIPVFADDLHNMKPEHCQNLLYFLGTGRQRTTSTVDMKAQGGRSRMGTAFFASESNVTAGMKSGAQKRVWELRGAPLPPNQAKLAYRIQRATTDGAGAMASLISEHLNTMEIDEVRGDIWAMANKYRDQHSKLEADDGQNLALLRWGLNLMEDILELDIPVDAVTASIAESLQEERVNEDDLPRAAMREIIQTISGMIWPTNHVDTHCDMFMTKDERLAWQGENIAWRRYKSDLDNDGRLAINRFEFNHRSKRVIEILHTRYSGYKCVVATWEANGWVKTSPNGKGRKLPTVKKAGCGWVTRLTEKGLDEFLSDPSEVSGDGEQSHIAL